MGSASADAEPGEAIDITFQLDYKEAAVKRLRDRDHYRYVEVIVFYQDGNVVERTILDHESGRHMDTKKVVGDDMNCHFTLLYKEFPNRPGTPNPQPQRRPQPAQPSVGSDPGILPSLPSLPGIPPNIPNVPGLPTDPQQTSKEHQVEVYASYVDSEEDHGILPPKERLFFLGTLTLLKKHGRRAQQA